MNHREEEQRRVLGQRLPRADIILTAADVGSEKIRNSVCAVIDVLRASTTIVAALANGSPGIIPVETPEEGVEAGGGKHLLAGERGGLRIEGFDLGNSPLEFTSDRVLGRFIVFTTTNGTRAIRACRQSEMVLVACFLNGKAVADFLNSLNRDVIIVCAGTDGEPSLEDSVCAGMLLSMLNKEPSRPAKDAVLLWRQHPDLLKMMKQESSHGRRLVELGFERDLEFAAQKNSHNIIPFRHGDLIVGKQDER